MKINRDFSNKLLKRRELEVVIESVSSPRHDEVMGEIVKKFEANEDVVVIKGIKSHFGSSEFVCNVFVYDSVEGKETIEPKKKGNKKKVGGES